MFYSQMLLSKKGPLGTVWFAAHCHKRLKKDQVKQTDICSSVDKILLDEVPVVTYRILAYLLLGVVRIYSKKVEYLFHDCHGVVARLSNFKVGKRKGASIGGMHAPHYSITFPKRFELDAFDLEVMEDQDVIDGNVRSREDIMLADELRKEGNTVHQLGKDHHEENISFTEAYSFVYTPVKDVYSLHPVDEQLGVNPSNNMNNSVASMEIFRGTEFFLEDRLDPMVLDEAENEQVHGRLSDEEREIAEEQMERPMTELNLQEEEPHDLARSFDKNEAVDAEHTRLPETVLDSRKCQRIEEFPTSIAVDVTSDSKDPGGAATPVIMAIRTPALKERAKVLKKRKCSFDDTIAVPNNMFKQWIDDPSDLICKRKNAPHTVLHAWRAHKLSNLPQTFLDPLFPCISLDLQSLECKKILPSEPIESGEIVASQDEAGFSVTPKSREQTPIAPATPVTHLASPRVQESRGVSVILEPSSSNEKQEKLSSLSEDLELNVNLMDEEKDSSEETGQEKNILSARTKTIASYLYGNFVRRKRCREDAIVKLSQVLEGKTKKGSARLFYEVLVLKTGKCIDVRQDNPYDDICLLETPVLRHLFEHEGVAQL